MKVAIIDYDLGNLFSVKQACEHVGLDAVVTADKSVIENADALILPGIGAFGDAMHNLRAAGLVDTLLNFAASGKPFLGICLGMQLLFTESEEFGHHQGLNLMRGKIVRFPNKDTGGNILRVPQIQWNRIYKNTDAIWNASPLKDLTEGTHMYFVHSYYAQPEDKNVVLSYSEYGGIRYASAVTNGNVTGIQYHPEKSAAEGLKIYKAWAAFIEQKKY